MVHHNVMYYKSMGQDAYEPELLKGNIKTIILAVLDSSSMHGYGISKEIGKRSSEALVFGEGTIYPALKALHREGFIVGEWVMPENGPAKKIYSITDKGRREFDRRKVAWGQFVRTIDRVIGGGHYAQPV